MIHPRGFDPDVVARFIRVGQQKYANVVLDLQTKRKLESLLYPRRVIHNLLPRFNSLVIDVIEEKILGYEKDTTAGLDRERLMKLLEPEHHEVVEMSLGQNAWHLVVP